MKPHGRVIGHAGGSLDHSSSAKWAKNAEVAAAGSKGEKLTAGVLDPIALQPGGPTVLHDVQIPIPNITANIDHIVVSGRTVTLIDAKLWKPGFYWTAPSWLGGKTRRGLSKFEPADKKTMAMAYDAITRYLNGTNATIAQPLVVIWPSSMHGKTSLWAMRMKGAKPIKPESLTRRKVGHKSADEAIVGKLARLAYDLPAASGF